MFSRKKKRSAAKNGEGMEEEGEEGEEAVVVDAEMKDASPIPSANREEDEEEEEEEEEEEDKESESEPEINKNAGSFTWTLKKFSKIKEVSLNSEDFTIGDYKWNILLYPRGNPAQAQTSRNNVSVYLVAADQKKMDWSWHRTAEFSISAINQEDENLSATKSARHTFRTGVPDWGFNSFISFPDLRTPGFLVNDTLLLRVDVEVLAESLNNRSWAQWAHWDSKKETGYVGVKNQGATCYMNSLLQGLYHLAAFRMAVYQMPTQNDEPESSIPLALQRVFYGLQFANNSVGTKELTASFGWNRRDSFIQHDAQELNRVLCDNLEEKMKGTISEGVIEKLFRGKIFNYIRCVNVAYESSRLESFYDISLNVKDMKDVYASFDQYVAVEMLDGDNKYDAGEHGHQDAEKGCFFESLPPVLELHLKRFVYDYERDRNFKINDRYEFPQSLNLSKYLHKNADMGGVKPLYRLYGVLVHSGDVHGGHYYAYIRPTSKMEWFKFDDERVTKVKKKEVFEGTFGGEDVRTVRATNGKTFTTTYKKSANAYMLLYVRASDRDQILAPIDPTHIPSHLQERFEREQAEKAAKKKEMAEAHLYIRVKVARLSDFKSWTGTDLVDFDQVKTFKVKKTDSLKEFKQVAAEEFGIPPERQRYWNCPSRRNGTTRPDLPYSARELEWPLEKLAKRGQSDFKIFLEESVAPEDCHDESLLFRPHVEDQDIIMLFKYYDPQAQSLRFICPLFVKVDQKIEAIIPELNKIMDFPETTSLLLFEEVKPNMVDPLKCEKTYKEAELSNGDIICFQKKPEEGNNYSRPEAPGYYSYMLNRVNVRFRELSHPDDDKHVIELAKDMAYDDVVQQLAKVLDADPMKIRLTQHSTLYDKPRLQPIKRSAGNNLTDMLSSPYHYSTKKIQSDILYYELLTISIEELENNKVIRVDWYNQKVELESSHTVLVPRTSHISDVIEKLKSVVELKGSGKIRLMEVHNHKIYRLLVDGERTTGYNEYTVLRAEEVPEDEIEKSEAENVKSIQVAHIYHDPPITQTFGNPFYLLVDKDEKFSETKKRIQRKLEISDEEFAQWKFAVVPWIGKPKSIEDDDVTIATRIDTADFLGLQHKKPRSKHTNRRQEVAIVIKN